MLPAGCATPLSGCCRHRRCGSSSVRWELAVRVERTLGDRLELFFWDRGDHGVRPLGDLQPLDHEDCITFEPVCVNRPRVERLSQAREIPLMQYLVLRQQPDEVVRGSGGVQPGIGSGWQARPLPKAGPRDGRL